MEITDDERKLIGFHLACRLEDFEVELKKNKQEPEDNDIYVKLEQLIYERIIPESFNGPRPKYWK